MDFKIRLADIPIEVHSQYDSLKEYCKDYVAGADGEKKSSEVNLGQEEHCRELMEIRITRADIEKEQEKVREDAVETESIEPQYSMQYLETLALLRKIAEELPDRDTFLMHGAVISWRGKAYMFTAPSGTGKSTHISLWKKYLGEDVQIINGDKPFIAVSETETRAYGTPWAGKERWQNHTSDTLKGICILAQAKENKIRRLSPGESLMYLLRQIHFTENPEKAGHILELVDQMLRQVPVWYLECDISEEAVKTSFEAMTGEEKWYEETNLLGDEGGSLLKGQYKTDTII